LSAVHAKIVRLEVKSTYALKKTAYIESFRANWVMEFTQC